VNRRFGRILAAVSYRFSLPPTPVRLISGACTATGIALVAAVRPSPVLAIAVSALLVLGYALDSADGQLARLRGGGSPAGEWLDHVLDAAKTSALHLCVLIGWYRFYDLDRPALLLVPIGYAVVGAVLFFAMWITDQMRRWNPDLAPKPADASGTAVLRSLLVIPTDYGVLILAFVTFAWPAVFATIYTLLFTGTALFLLAALPKWFREVSTFPAARRA
jgi:phosphatidylglycerophosphate synthase